MTRSTAQPRRGDAASATGSAAAGDLSSSRSAAPTRRSQERRRQLLDAADRVVRRDGPDASMVTIAAEAGVTKPILYRHFGDKGGLYQALAERHTATLLERLHHALSVPADRSRRTLLVVDAYLASIEAEPAIYRFLMHRAAEEEPAVGGMVASFTEQIAELLAVGIAGALGDPAESHRARAWGFGMVGAVQAAGDWWLDTAALTRAELAEHLAQLLAHGWAGAS